MSAHEEREQIVRALDKESDWAMNRGYAATAQIIARIADQIRALPVADDAGELGALVREIAEWQSVTFPAATPASAAEHLRREAVELCADPCDPEELADVFLLAVSVANGVQPSDPLGYLTRAVAAKLTKNRARVWGQPDAHGVVEHVRDTTQAPDDAAAPRVLVGNEAGRFVAAELQRIVENLNAEGSAYIYVPDLATILRQVADHLEARSAESDEELAYQRGLADGRAQAPDDAAELAALREAVAKKDAASREADATYAATTDGLARWNASGAVIAASERIEPAVRALLAKRDGQGVV